MVMPGGRGNAALKCGSDKEPKIAENGEEGLEIVSVFLIVICVSLLVVRATFYRLPFGLCVYYKLFDFKCLNWLVGIVFSY